MKKTLPDLKRLAVACLALFTAVQAHAQSMRSAFFMENSLPALKMNPAVQPQRGFVSIPALGATSIGAATQGAYLSDLFYEVDGSIVTFMDESIGAEDFLGRLSSRNRIYLDVSNDILAGGWYGTGGFWNVGISLKFNSSVNAPRELFEFMKLDMLEDNELDYLLSNRDIDIRNLNIHADSYLETAVGYSRAITNRLTVGGKFKFLLGVGNLDVTFNNIYANRDLDNLRWSILTDGKMSASLKGLEAVSETDSNGNTYIDDYDFNTAGIAGTGIGFDFGGTFKLMDNLTLSASVLDLGFITWSKNSTINARSNRQFDFDGFSDGNKFSDLVSDLEELLHLEEEEASSYTTSLRSTINIGGEYSILENRLGFGLLSSTRFYKANTYTELTASVNGRPNHWFSATFSYSVVHSNFRTFGLVLNFHPSCFNFFIGSDYTILGMNKYIPRKMGAANVYMGMSVPIGKRKI